MVTGASVVSGSAACSGPEEDLFGNTEAVSGSGASGGSGATSSTGGSAGAGATTGGEGGGGGVPSTCGDGVLDPEEQCDGADLGGASCVDLGFSSPGGLVCTARCTIDDSGCKSTCDGAKLEPDEACDGAEFGGQSCVDFGYSSEDGLACADCRIDAEGCAGTCGDQVQEPDEACDGADLGGQSCVDFGFVAPAGLACEPGCQGFDDAGCVAACNGVLEPGEVCDGAELGGHDCTELGFSAAAGMACTSCQLDPSGCKATCGDSKVEPGEACDDGDTASGDGCSSTCHLEGVVCDDAIAVALDLGTLTFEGSTAGGGQHGSQACPAAGNDRIYAVTVGADGFLTATLTRPATSFDSVLYARSDCGNAGSLLACADSQGAAAGGGEVISFPVDNGQTIYVFVDGVSQNGDYQLTLDLSTGESCADPVPITIEEGSAMTLFGDTNNAGNDEQSATCGGASSGDVVYRVVRPQSGSMTLELDTSYNSVLYAQPACGSNFNAVCDNEAAGNGGESIFLPTVTGGDPFYAWVDGFNGAEGSYSLVLTP